MCRKQISMRKQHYIDNNKTNTLGISIFSIFLLLFLILFLLLFLVFAASFVVFFPRLSFLEFFFHTRLCTFFWSNISLRSFSLSLLCNLRLLKEIFIKKLYLSRESMLTFSFRLAISLAAFSRGLRKYSPDSSCKSI